MNLGPRTPAFGVWTVLCLLFSAVQLAAAAPGPPPATNIPSLQAAEELLYYSPNLAGHSLFAECNPGGILSCPCSLSDVALVRDQPDYATLISNVHTQHTCVNALGIKKFTRAFPDDRPIRLGQYRYSARVRLPLVPKADFSQITNAHAVHLMLQFWDGQNALWNANSNTLEGTLYWALDPWKTNTFGQLRVYTAPDHVVPSGLTVPPDTNWHQFSLSVDLVTRRYISASVDGKSVDLSALPLCQVPHPDWDKNLDLMITTESMATYPGQGCSNRFTWPTCFQNVALSKLTR